MRLDMHTHGKLAKKVPFSPEYTDWLFGEAKEAGLDALCLTEHFNTLGFNEVYEYIARHYEAERDTFLTREGLRIFPGMEVDIAEGGHTLVIGNMHVILEMNRRLEPYKEKGHFLPAREWMQIVQEYPVLFGAAHPYRAGGHIPELPEDILRTFEFLDMNGKDMAEDYPGTVRRMRELSKKLGKPLAAGSDTHQALQYGCVYNVFDQTVRTVDGLRTQIQGGNYRIETSDTLKIQVESAGELKRSLKKIHALGGDYVEVLLRGA